MILGNGEAQRLRGEVDRHHGGNVGGAESLAGDECRLREPHLQVCLEVDDPLAAAFHQRRNLFVVVGAGNRAAFQPCSVVADSLHHGRKALELRPALHMVTSALSLGEPPRRGGVG